MFTFNRLMHCCYRTTVVSLLLVATVAQAGQREAIEQGMQSLVDAYAQGKAIVDETIASDPLLDENDDLVRAEGYRWVSRIISGVERSYLGHDNSPAHPSISRLPTTLFKLGWDSPDFAYLTIGPLDDAYTYRVYGKRNSQHLVLFQVLNKGGYGGGDDANIDELNVSADGGWEIVLGKKRPKGASNWMALDDKSDRLLVRNIYNDWNEVEASVGIEMIDGPERGAPLMDGQDFIFRSAKTAKSAVGSLNAFAKISRQFEINRFPVPCPGVLTGCEKDNVEIGGNKDQLHTTTRYHVAEGKVLLVEVPAADARFRNVQLGNIWHESLDYANRQTSLNSFQDYLDEDGVYRYVLSHSDPGYQNWLDISQHPYGTIFFRWTLANLKKPPQAPVAKLLDAEELAAIMPESHPRLTPLQRSAVMKERLRQVNYRINPAGVGM